jgi:hypothetical protein
MQKAVLGVLLLVVWGICSAIVMFLSLYSWSNQKITVCAVAVGIAIVSALAVLRKGQIGWAFLLAASPSLLLFFYL